MKYPLQPLRIPSGWTIGFHQFHELDPLCEEAQNNTDLFSGSLLQIKNEHTDRLLDLGWYPDGDLKNGTFGLVLYKGDFLGPLLYEHRTRNISEVIAEIERMALLASEGKI